MSTYFKCRERIQQLEAEFSLQELMLATSVSLQVLELLELELVLIVCGCWLS